MDWKEGSESVESDTGAMRRVGKWIREYELRKG